MPDLERTSPEEVPAPDALAILFRVAVGQWLAGLPKDEALKILRGMAEDLATEESLAAVFLIRAPRDHPAVNRERRRAIALFRRFLPIWLASVDEG